MDQMPATIDTNYVSGGVPPTAPQNQSYYGGAPPSGDVIDTEFMKGVRGVLKVLQMVFSLVTFICASISTYRSWGAPYVQTISMIAFILTAVLYILHSFRITPRLPASVYFKFDEFCYYAFFTLNFFICGIVCSVSGSVNGSVGAAAFFSFASMLLYGADVYFSNMAWRHSGEGPYCCFPDPTGGAGGAYPPASAQAAGTVY